MLLHFSHYLMDLARGALRRIWQKTANFQVILQTFSHGSINLQIYGGFMENIEVLNGSMILKSSNILSFIHNQNGDSVILSGTLIEGIGNAMSDLDIYVLTPNRQKFRYFETANHAFCHRRDMELCTMPDDEVFMTMDYYPGTSTHMDVEYWTYEEIDRLQTKVDKSYSSLLQHADLNWEEYALSRVEHLLIHRLFAGISLVGSNSVQTRFDKEFKSKYCYVLYRSISNHYWGFKDLIGAYVAKNSEMLCELGRNYLIGELRASLHLNGISNPTAKWFWTYLKECQNLDIVSLRPRIIEVLQAVTINDSERYLFEVLEIVQEIERANRKLLDFNPIYVSCERCLSLLDEEAVRRNISPSPALDHELQFRRRTWSDAAPTYRDLLVFQ